MSIEQQVPTLETCKKLDKAGIDFNSTWMWWDEDSCTHVSIRVPLHSRYAKFYQAPTVQELLTTIPKLRATISRIGKEWWVEYINYTIKGDNLAEVLADLVLKIKYC